MTEHILKLDITYFDDVKSGKKNFEIRKYDRDFKVGDILKLKAYKDGKYQVKDISGLDGGFLAWNYFVLDDETGDLHFATADEAETITAKVTAIMAADDYNSYSTTRKTPNQFDYINAVERNGHWFVFSIVDELLSEYFHTDRLPDDYVVLGIEVQDEC